MDRIHWYKGQMGLGLGDNEIPLIKNVEKSRISLLVIETMRVKFQHQGVPEGLLKIIRASSNGNLPRPSFNFQFSLFQSIFSFTLNTNDLDSNSLALTAPQFYVFHFYC